MAVDIAGILTRLGFADVLLWLLTFAIVYGVLSEVNIPKDSKEIRAIIAIVLGFFVLMAAPAGLLLTLSKMSSSLIVILLGLFVLLVFLEIGGVKHIEGGYVIDKEGKVIKQPEQVPFFSKNVYVLAIAFIIIVALIFIGAGGLNLLGWKLPYNFDITGIAFVVMIIIAVLWMLTEGGK